MSATTFQIDQYLASQTMPPNDLVVDPQYKNLRMVTPVGRFMNIHVDKPFAIPNKTGKPGVPKYSATLAFAPGTNENPIVVDLYKAIVMVANATWAPTQRPDPANPSNLITMTAEQLLFVDEKLGGLHYPLRQGDDNYMREPQKFEKWRGLYFINASMFPQTKTGQEQKPIIMDERGMACDPSKFYPGCYGRMQVTVASYSNEGKGITFYINAVQFARHGERVSTFDAGAAAANAFAKAGALSGDIGTAPSGWPTGTGLNTATSAPPGASFGFAAPPAAVVPAQQPQPQQMPPQAAPATFGGGARPPGV